MPEISKPNFNQASRSFELMRQKLGESGLALLENQLATWAELNERPLKSPLKEALASGNTTLPEGTLLHGMGQHDFSAEALKGVAEHGIVSGELIGIVEDAETNGCADFFRVPAATTIGEYFDYAKTPLVVGRIRKPRDERMLTQGVTFIVDPQAEGMDGLLDKDGYRNPEVAEFVRPAYGRTAEDTAAILGGVPRGAIAGIVVDAGMLQRPEVAAAINGYFPDTPLLTLDGTPQFELQAG